MFGNCVSLFASIFDRQISTFDSDLWTCEPIAKSTTAWTVSHPVLWKTSEWHKPKLPLFQVTYRKLTCGPSKCCLSWRSPWSSYKMLQMARCMKVWPMAHTPRVPYSSISSWFSVTFPSVTSGIPGSLNTLLSYTGPFYQVSALLI